MKPSVLPLLLAAASIGLAAPGAALAHSRHHQYAAPPARVQVTNQSGAAMTLTLTGQSPRTVAAWETAVLYAPAGETTFRATYKQFGAERVLESERLYLQPERTARIVLEPEDTARTLVVNDSPYDAVLLVNGRSGPSFAPGASRIVTAPVGRTDLTLVANGRTLGHAELDLRAFAETRWVFCPPKVGDLLVQNPLPVSVELVSANGQIRVVPAFGETLYKGLPAGSFALTARRTTDEFIDRESAEIRMGGLTTWRVDPPRTGFVDLDSDHFMGAEVKIDGRCVGTLAPDMNRRFEASVGWHQVEVRDESGRVILNTWVEVEAFDVERVAFGYPVHTQARDGHHDRHDRDDRHDRHEEAQARR